MILGKINASLAKSSSEEPEDKSPLIYRSPSISTKGGEPLEIPDLDLTDADGNRKPNKPFVIGVCGGNCAGKLGVVSKFIKKLGSEFVAVLFQENFYKEIPPEIEKNDLSRYNFDDPAATDWRLMKTGLEHLINKMPFTTPLFDVQNSKRMTTTQILEPRPIIIVEGLLILYFQDIREQLDLKIYLDTDDDVRLSRRVIKDVYGKGLDVESVIHRYEKFVKPAHDKYVLPSKKYADIILPNYGRELTDELVEITQKLKLSNISSGHKADSFKSLDPKVKAELYELANRYNTLDNMGITLIVEFINNKLKRPKNRSLEIKIDPKENAETEENKA